MNDTLEGGMDGFDIGDYVRIIAGRFVGETGEVDAFDREQGLVLVSLEKDGIGVAVTPVMLEHATKPTGPAVNILKHGMTSEDLANAVGLTMQYCMSRIRGVGNEQYSEETHQKFEAMSMDDLIEYQLEEIADDINYGVMRFIRLRRIQEAMKEHL